MATLKDQRIFLDRIERACRIARQKGAIFNEAVATAQAAHESGWGTSQLARKWNNLFGMKTGSKWTGEWVELPTWEWINGKKVPTTAKWRVYLSWNLCLVDYYHFIKDREWFAGALDYVHDAEKFFLELLPQPPSAKWPKGKWGWATDPIYYSQVKKVAVEVEQLGGPKWR